METGSDAEAGVELDVSSTGTVHEQASCSPAAIPSSTMEARGSRSARRGLPKRQRGSEGVDPSRHGSRLRVGPARASPGAPGSGREAEAGSLLKSLEASAHAPSVRRKSAELLARLRDRPAPRSTKSHAGTPESRQHYWLFWGARCGRFHHR
jgi:hypothetical protein